LIVALRRRLFSLITGDGRDWQRAWQAALQPPVDRQAHRRHNDKNRLTIHCELDPNHIPPGIKVSMPTTRRSGSRALSGRMESFGRKEIAPNSKA
jgi:hypothetical protein